MAIDLICDEFNRAKIADIWEIGSQAGVYPSATGGFLQWECRSACVNVWVIQRPLIIGDFDVWTRIILPTAAEVSPVDASVGVWLDCMNSLNDIWLGLSYTQSTDKDYENDWGGPGVPISPRQFVAYIGAYDDATGDLIDTVGAFLGQDNNDVYFRMKFAAGVPSFYYALTEPVQETDWSEMDPGKTLTTEFSEDDNEVYSSFGFSQWGNAGNDTGLYFKVGFLRTWPASGLFDQEKADLDDVFYNIEEMAEMIVYQPAGGSAQSIRAILLTEDTPLQDPEVLGDNLRIRVRTSDVRDPGRDAVFINGQRWNVIRNAGGGLDVGEWELEISRSDQRVL